MGRPKRNLEQKILAFKAKFLVLPNGCWQWQSTKSSTGYGMFYFYPRAEKAHRVSFKLFCSDIPLDKLVLHRCNNKLCVNPDHLYLGTHKDNHNDMVEASTDTKGERNGMSKLSVENVLEIRRLYVPYIYGDGKLARQFGVSRKTINRIINKVDWKHI